MDIHIQPSKCETSTKEHRPQYVNNKAIDIIKRLSFERFLGINNFIKNPNNPPTTSAARFIKIGLITLIKLNEPAIEAIAIDIATL